jgi:hypothetical protein
MRIATWNVNSLKARMERVEEWLAGLDAIVLTLIGWGQFWSSRWGQMRLSFPAARRHDRRSQ